MFFFSYSHTISKDVNIFETRWWRSSLYNYLHFHYFCNQLNIIDLTYLSGRIAHCIQPFVCTKLLFFFYCVEGTLTIHRQLLCICLLPNEKCKKKKINYNKLHIYIYNITLGGRQRYSAGRNVFRSHYKSLAKFWKGRVVFPIDNKDKLCWATWRQHCFPVSVHPAVWSTAWIIFNDLRFYHLTCNVSRSTKLHASQKKKLCVSTPFHCHIFIITESKQNEL